MKPDIAKTAVALTLTLACAGPGGRGEIEDSTAPGTVEADTLTRTVVVLDREGRQRVRTEIVTPGQIEEATRNREARFARMGNSRPASVPAGQLADLAQGDCNDDRALWLFDAANLAGNQLCLIREVPTMDAVGLVNIPHPGFRQHWGARVRSFFPGSDPGYFRIDQTPYSSETFKPFVRANTVSSTVRNANVVALTAPGATFFIPLFGYQFNVTTCSQQPILILEGDLLNIVPVQGHLVDIPNRGTACQYEADWDFRWGVDTTIAHYGGGCTLRLLEGNLFKAPDTFFGQEAHFFDDGCHQSPP